MMRRLLEGIKEIVHSIPLVLDDECVYDLLASVYTEALILDGPIPRPFPRGR